MYDSMHAGAARTDSQENTPALRIKGGFVVRPVEVLFTPARSMQRLLIDAVYSDRWLNFVGC